MSRRQPGTGIPRGRVSRDRHWPRTLSLTALVSGLARPTLVVLLMTADVQAQSLGDTSVAASSAQTAPPAPLAGWSTFEIKKTRAEMTETARLADDAEPSSRTGPIDVKLPPQDDVLRVVTGIGYLQGADAGGDISAAGKINGMQTDANLFFGYRLDMDTIARDE
jgi:hypothetical protein